MNIVYYSSMMTGSGHIVQGLSVARALKRNGINADFTILHCGGFGELADRENVSHVELPPENEKQLGADNFKSSALFLKLAALKPDVLLVDLSWYTLRHFIDGFDCLKIFLCRQVSDDAFSIPLPGDPLVFEPKQYDRIIATEPFDSKITMEQINPIVIRNRDEILPRAAALEKLSPGGGSKICLFSVNGKPGEYEEIKKTYSYLEEEGYQIIYTTNFQEGLFPAVDYFNAVDLLVCGAGYNAFWEAVYFEKETIFYPFKRRFENQRLRVETCSGYRFEENGADQLVRMIVKA